MPDKLDNAITIYTTFYIDCCICCEANEDSNLSKEDYINGLKKDGWTYGVSDKFAVEGPMCPECSVLPDNERGE